MANRGDVVRAPWYLRGVVDADSVPYPRNMESTKNSKGVVIAILVLVVMGLTALDVYQDRIIAKQRFEMTWLLTHATIRPDLIAADVAKNAQGAAMVNRAQAPAASVAQVPPTTKPAAPARPAAKP